MNSNKKIVATVELFKMIINKTELVEEDKKILIMLRDLLRNSVQDEKEAIVIEQILEKIISSSKIKGDLIKLILIEDSDMYMNSQDNELVKKGMERSRTLDREADELLKNNFNNVD